MRRSPTRVKLPSSVAILLLVMALVTAIAGQPAAAQTTLERLEVALWPEYDQPSMLVMLRAFLPADTQLPVQVTLPMPQEAGVPNAVAKRGPEGGLLVAQHTFDITDDLTLVQVVTDSREIRLEYYQPLEITGDNRRFLFEWPGFLPLGELTFEVIQPLDVTAFAVTPAATVTQGGNGLTYHHGDLGSREAGTTAAIEILYTKSTASLTASALQQAAPPPTQIQLPPATEPAEQPEEASAPSTWPVVVGVLLIGFIGGYLVARSSRKKNAK